MSVIIPLPDTAHEFHPDDMITKQSIGGQVLFAEASRPIAGEYRSNPSVSAS